VTADEQDGRTDFGNLVVLDGVEYRFDAARDILAKTQLELIGPPPEEPMAPPETTADPGEQEPADPDGKTQPEEPGPQTPEQTQAEEGKVDAEA